ncbi:hypothetical protein Dsin_019219 [Dipteronia sinensis]|uniref:Transposase MuDR plant domain-containing protein n=1 Tax=Dipteronia sinensis TaxID=43782 RepID=A0AAE0A858_9ROSI|nr:hypothetical protein Dsin_019219 [Dipteronia sinensis]
MDWVTVLIKIVNMLPNELGLFLDPKGIHLNPLARRKSISDDGWLYKGKIFQCKKDLKRILHMYALKEQFEVRIRRSSKTCDKAGCKDGECEFQLRAFKMQKGEYS